jgi:hypothetical protein
VNVTALHEKKVDLHSVAIALASKVFPFPGGPKSKMPFAGDLMPLKISGLRVGRMIVSLSRFFTVSRPWMSAHLMFGE